MIATLVSIAFALMFAFYYQATPSSWFPIVALAVGLLILLITPIIKGLTYLPLQAASVEISSRALQYARRDYLLKALSLIWILFGLFSIVLAAFAFSPLFYVWVVWLGLSLDAIYWFVHRVTGYCDPHAVVNALKKQGEDAVQSIGYEKEYFEAVDGVGEVGLKALLQRGTALAVHAIEAFEDLAAAVIGQVGKEQKEGKITEDEGRDRLNYSLGYLLGRLQMVYQQAGEEGLEGVASKALLSLSKMILKVVKVSPEVAGLPLHFTDKFLQHAEEKDLREVGLKGSIIFQQLAKELIESDRPVAGILFDLIGKMEEEAKELFKQDKQTPITILTQPFEELTRIMDEKKPTFPEAELVKRNLDRVIGEFLALQEVLRTVPNIPGYSEKEA